MRYIFLILVLFSFSTQAQNKVIQNYDYLYVYPSASVVQVPTCVTFAQKAVCYNSLISTDTIARIHDNGVVVWKATLAAANISDTLNTGSYEGMCRVNVPTTFNTQRVVQLRDVAIIFQTTTYTLQYGGAFYQFPITIRKNSDASIMCVIYESGAIDWQTTPQWAWLGRVGTTRVKRITLP